MLCGNGVNQFINFLFSRRNPLGLLVVPDENGTASGDLFWDDGASIGILFHNYHLTGKPVNGHGLFYPCKLDKCISYSPVFCVERLIKTNFLMTHNMCVATKPDKYLINNVVFCIFRTRYRAAPS